MGITLAVEQITPEIAKKYLLTNVANYRKMSRARIKQYAADMIHSRWESNGETLVFDENGILKDGQHRLAAIVASGVTEEMCVARGVSANVTIYDIGMQRTSNQIARANDVDLPPQCVSTAKIIVNHFKSAPKGIELDYLRSNQAELARAYRICCLGTGMVSKRTSLVAATYLMLRTEAIRSYEAELFFKVFNTRRSIGMDGYDPSPAKIARQMFDERFQRQQSTMALREQLEILILAMEDFHNGVHREANYVIAQPFHHERMIDIVRKTDGLI